MDQLSQLFENIINFVLGNIGIVIFAVFLLSGFIGRGNKDKAENPETRQQPASHREAEHDDRPLAERLAEYFGVEVPEEANPQPQQQQATSAQGRRSTTTRNVQQEYPTLFGGSSMFESQQDSDGEQQWGFDETEWGSTFARSEEQWGNTFPERKSSEPVIEWPR